LPCRVNDDQEGTEFKENQEIVEKEAKEQGIEAIKDGKVLGDGSSYDEDTKEGNQIGYV